MGLMSVTSDRVRRCHHEYGEDRRASEARVPTVELFLWNTTVWSVPYTTRMSDKKIFVCVHPCMQARAHVKIVRRGNFTFLMSINIVHLCMYHETIHCFQSIECPNKVCIVISVY